MATGEEHTEQSEETEKDNRSEPETELVVSGVDSHVCKPSISLSVLRIVRPLMADCSKELLFIHFFNSKALGITQSPFQMF